MRLGFAGSRAAESPACEAIVKVDIPGTVSAILYWHEPDLSGCTSDWDSMDFSEEACVPSYASLRFLKRPRPLEAGAVLELSVQFLGRQLVVSERRRESWP